MSYDDPEKVPPVWEIGDVILDRYEVRQVFTSGGMGLVYRVHHRNWNVDLAVKSPRPEFLQTKQQIDNFEREAETWVNLGLHPHTVSCYYVRRLGDIPRIFTEFVDGGSLANWVRSRRLYEGGSQESLQRILDIAIQSAWGLGYAHQRGLIHQDVKPANMLMTGNGVVKITDFGLAKARSASSEERMVIPGQSMLATYGGRTPAYCSPEQAEMAAPSPTGMVIGGSRALSRRTDIWSWGISVMEMFLGYPPCIHGGHVAAKVLERYLESPNDWDLTIPKMPERLVELLRRCFERDQQQRPNNMAEIISVLREVWHQSFGVQYLRTEPQAVDLLADGLNNRAASLLDLNRQELALKQLHEALDVDPLHTEATYNRGIILWRSGRVTDQDLICQLGEIRRAKADDWKTAYAIGLVHLARADVKGALQAFEEAVKCGGGREATTARDEAESLPLAESSQCLRAFKGHTDVVDSVCLSSDKDLALSGSWDKTLRLWDVATGQCLRTFKGHSEGVRSVCLSSDNRWALSGSSDKTLRLWDVATGQCLLTFLGNMGPGDPVCLSSDNRWALSGGGYDNSLRLWDVATGKCLRTFMGHAEGVISVCLSSDNRLALSGSWDKTIRLWDVDTGECLRTFEGHMWDVYSVCLSADNRLALSGSRDKTLRLWDVATGRCLRTFEEPGEAVHSACLSPDNRWALSGDRDHKLRLWDVSRGQCLRTFEGHSASVNSVCLSADKRWALSGSSDGMLRLWDVGALTIRGDRQSLPALLCDVASNRFAVEAASQFERFITAGRATLGAKRWPDALAHARKARSVHGYELAPDALELWASAGLHSLRRNFREAWGSRTFEGHTDGVHAACLSSDNRWALSSGDKTLRLWDVATGQCLRAFEGHTDWVGGVCLSSDNRWGLSGSWDKTLRLWDLSTGQCLRTFDGQGEDGLSVCLSSDSRWALSGSFEYGTLRLWDVTTGQCLRTFKGHTERNAVVCLSSDSRRALSGGWDKTLRLWDVASGQCLRTFEGHTDGVNAVCLSSDSRWALSGSFDKTVRLWDVTTGQCLRTFEGHTDRVRSVCLSSDNRWALTASGDRTVRLWDVNTGECLRSFEGHTDVVDSVCLSSDSRWALSGSFDKTLRLWELDWEFERHDLIDWDVGAQPLVESFIIQHTPYSGDLPADRKPTDEEITRALTRAGKASWTEEDLEQLIRSLACAGYGWLRPEGVRQELENMAEKAWLGPQQLPLFKCT